MNLNHVTLPVTDLESAIDFYRRMGFTQITYAPPRYARFECPQGDSTFSLHAVPGPPTNTGVVVYFECSDLDERVQALQSAGFMFTQLPTDAPWLWREARLVDPSGNTLCLFHAGENRRHPPWRISR